jgi:hypothetical protein
LKSEAEVVSSSFFYVGEDLSIGGYPKYFTLLAGVNRTSSPLLQDFSECSSTFYPLGLPLHHLTQVLLVLRRIIVRSIKKKKKRFVSKGGYLTPREGLSPKVNSDL